MPDRAASAADVQAALAARRRLRGLELVRPKEVGHMVMGPDGRTRRFVVDHDLDPVTAPPFRVDSRAMRFSRAGCGFPGEWA